MTTVPVPPPLPLGSARPSTTDAPDSLCLAADDAAGHLDDPDLDVVRAALDRVLWATVALDVATT
jgi:hypothetical protein